MFKHLRKLLLLAALLVPWATQAQTDSCTLKIVGEDGYADGWNGGYLSVVQGGTTIATFDAANADNDGEGPELDSTFVTVASDAAVSFVWSSGYYDDEVTIWIYNSSGALLFSVTEPTAGTIFTVGSPCSNCFAPANLQIDSLSMDYARAIWGGATDSFGILWGETDDVAAGSGTATTATDTYFEMTNLSASTSYTIMVWAICDDGETSDTTTISFVTIGEAISEFPYTTGFESGDDIGWEFVNNNNNQWFIGTAAYNSGSNGLYISNDNGTSNAYTTSSTQFSYAYRALSITDDGQYGVSFDWKAYGESNYDYLRAWIAPSTMQLTAGQTPEGGTSAYGYTTSTPAGWIDLGGKMNLKSTWQNTVATPNLTAGTYFLVFMWANDGSSGSQPPAAIDNVTITQLTCPQPTDLTVTPHSYDADLAWTAGGDESLWEIVVSDTMVYYSTSDNFTVTDLEPYTYYHFSVRAICGAGDTSFATTTGDIRTLPSCPQPTDLSVDSVTTSEIILSWTPGGDESEWLVTLNDSSFVTSDYDPLWITDLPLNTLFSISVRALCSEDDTSFVTGTSARTLAGEPISEFPYVCGFEVNDDGEDEGAIWVLENGTQANYWIVGTNTYSSGSKSLYITNDGTSNGYNTSSTSYVFAYATFQFEAGEYSYSYDWKANGESSYDFIRAAVVPTSTAITAGSYCGFSNTSAVPTGGVAIDGAYRLNLQSSWQTQNGTFSIAEEGLYNVVFMWRNDGSGGTMPPAAIDNISIEQLTCPSPVAFAVDTIEPFQATLSWTPTGDEGEWLVRAISAAGTDDWQSVSSNPYVYTGLNSGTDYSFELMAVCSSDDSSFVVTCSGSTPVTCPVPTNFAVTVTGTDADFTWTDENGSSWEVAYGTMGFNPYVADNVGTTSTTSFQVSGLDTGFYEAYLRTDCGDGDYSAWVGPISYTYGVTIINMNTTGSDTLITCAGIVYDDGGPNGSYSANCQSTLVILPSTPGAEVMISGISYTEGSYDYLRIYDGIGTDGEELWNDYGVSATQSFGPFASNAITVVFHSDGSVFYSGFQINVACTEPSNCPRPTHFTANTTQPDSLEVSWWNPASASSFELVIGAPGIIPDTVAAPISLNDTFYVFNNLVGGVTYEAYVRANCGSEYSNWTGPLTIVPGQYIMGTSGSASISMCGGVIYDDGGTGQYSNNVDFQLTVYPSSNDSMLTFYGSAYTESSIDYLRIYEGVGTNGNILWQTSSSSSQESIPLITCMSGPITLHFHTDVSVVYDGFELHVNCVAAPECAAVENLAVAVGPVSAMATWDEGFFGTYSGATVEYKEATDSVWNALPMVTGTYAAITGLTPATQYDLRVTTNCEGYDGEVATTTFTTSDFGCLVIDATTSFSDTLIDGTSTSSYIPSYSTYNYSLTQQIFTATEIGHGGQISSISFKPSAYTVPRDFEIYMGHVSQATATSYLTPADLTLVYSGSSIMLTAGQWNTLTLNTAFNYNGADNLIIYVRDMTGSWTNGNTWYGADGTSGVSRYAYRDDSPYVIGSFTGGTTGSFRSSIILSGAACAVQSTCAAPVAVVTDVTTTTVDVTWAPGNTETSWNVYYRLTGSTAWSSPVSVSSTTYQFTNLSSGTNYDFKVESVCDTQSLGCTVQTATLCAPISVLPYTENFNSWAVGTIPNCWAKTGTYSPNNYSVISGSYNHSGNGGGSVYMYASTTASNKSWLILPAIDTNLYAANELQLLYHVYTSTSYEHPTLEIGVMDDAGDVSTFVSVATVQHPGMAGQWDAYQVPLTNYTGNGSYVAIRTTNSSTIYFYLDDVTLELTPACPRVDSLMAGNATATSTDLSWNDYSDGNTTQWQIEYGPFGFVPGTGTLVTANSNPFTLSNPTCNSGSFYVRPICSTGDTSYWSLMAGTFYLGQTPATLPYSYDFENVTEWNNWQGSYNNLERVWVRGNAVAHNGSYSMYISADQGATYVPYYNNAVVNSAIFRDIDFGTVDSSYDFSFSARAGGSTAGNYDGLMVFLADPTVTPIASGVNLTSPWGHLNNLDILDFIRVDTTWQTYQIPIDNLSGVHRVVFFWFNQNTNTNYSPILEPAAVDDINIDYTSCPRPANFTTMATGAHSATIGWQGPSNVTYEVVYRLDGGTNQFTTCNTNHITLTGLDSMATYYMWVRKVCGAGDTSFYSDAFQFTTPLCDNGAVAMNYDASLSSTTTSYGPIGYSYYNYSYVQTLIDSAYMASIGGAEVGYFGFNPTTVAAGSTYYTGMNIYMANVPESDLSAGWILPDDSAYIFQQVLTNDTLNFTETGWQVFQLDTTFVWDGHSNVLVSVVRNHGSYASGPSFSAHSTGSKMRYAYRDSSPYDYTNPDVSGTLSSYSGDIMLISCNAGSSCAMPTGVYASNVTYNGATLNWTASASSYEVQYKAGTDAGWTGPVTVSSNSYQLTGLNDSTIYFFQVRSICVDEESGETLYSNWADGSFTTLYMPCFVPTELEAQTVTYSTTTLNWEENGVATQWNVHVWNTQFDSIYSSTSHTFVVSGLTQNTDYYVAVSAQCGTTTESGYGDTIAIHTLTCQPPTGLTVTNKTATSATIVWGGSGIAFDVEYGDEHFSEGVNTQVVHVTGNTYTITGLEPEYDYSVSVRAECEEGVYSAYCAQVDFTTPAQGEGIENAGTANVTLYPNPTSNATTIAISGVNGEVEITLVDLSGRVVMTDSMSCTGDCAKKLEVSGLSQGAYFVRLSGENVNMVKKVVVK